jgi:proteasome lid subunit RPN8/RPN11
LAVIVLQADQFAQIQREGVAAYPNECCGAMLGKDVTENGDVRRLVQRLEPLANAFAAEEKYHRFSLDPRQLMQVEKRAAEAGLAVLGFYHSHPDHPARPSEYDRQHAWPFYSYIIVAIAGGEPADMTSWKLDEQTETFGPEEILRQDSKGKS